MNRTSHCNEKRDQDFWEDNNLLSEVFDLDSVGECPLLRGGMRPLLERTWSRILMTTVMNILQRLMILPPEDLQAFAMHWKKYSDRKIGELLGIDHKTAKKKYQSVFAKIREASPAGSRKQKPKGQSPPQCATRQGPSL